MTNSLYIYSVESVYIAEEIQTQMYIAFWMSLLCYAYGNLTHCGLMTTYGIRINIGSSNSSHLIAEPSFEPILTYQGTYLNTIWIKIHQFSFI